jgi:Ankyrin repeats (3 copies)
MDSKSTGTVSTNQRSFKCVMGSKKALIVSGMLLILCLTFFWVPPSAKAQVEGLTKGQPVEENKFGFPIWIAVNDAVNSSNDSRRHIFILVEAANFNEQNIMKLFTSLAGEFRFPDDLTIYAYSDRTALQKAIKAVSSYCYCWISSPEVRRASRACDIKLNPHQSGFYRAEYRRWADGREARIYYSPNPDQEHLKTIYHVNPSFNYSDPIKDFTSAAQRGDVEAIKLRLAKDKSEKLLKAAGDKALQGAASNGQAEIVNTLLNAGVVAKSEGGNAALLAAAIDGNAEIVQTLLDREADANARTGRIEDELDDSVLMLAAQHGHPDVVRALLAKGAQIDDRNRFGETALMQAALAGFPQVIRLLAAKGANVNARDVNGRTALMLGQDDRETVETLLNAGADYKVIDNDGETALLLAVHEPAKQDALIAKGAGKESIEAAKRRIAAPPGGLATALASPFREWMPLDYVREEGYRVLRELYLKLGMKSEAVETRKEMLEVLGDKARLRVSSALFYLALGRRDSAMAEYWILKDRADYSRDHDVKKLYQSCADSLWKELNK